MYSDSTDSYPWQNYSGKNKSNEALPRTPRVLHPGVLSRTNRVTSRTFDFLVFGFCLVSKVIENNKLIFKLVISKIIANGSRSSS
jgi:hypothetical protein